MKWNELTSEKELNHLLNESAEKPILIFKHSTRCSISATALARFEREWEENDRIVPYYLNLLAHRNLSDWLAETFGVKHESPQILLIRNGKCIYHQSHLAIRFSEVMQHLV